MGATISNRARPFKVVGNLPITSIRVTFTVVPKKQRRLPGEGITDVVNDVLILPISAKYPAIALVRWVDSNGTVQGEEQTVDFIDTDLYPPSNVCTGFEIYVKSGSVFTVQIEGGDPVMNPADYYLKTEVDALLAMRAFSSAVYTKAETDAVAFAKADAAEANVYNNIQYARENDLSRINFISTTAPSSPIAGLSWREIDGSGNIIMDWRYNSTLSKWQSIEQYEMSLAASGLTASGAPEFLGTANKGSHNIRLTQLRNNIFVASPNTGADYWTYQIQVFAGTTKFGSLISTVGKGVATEFREQQTLSNLILSSASQSFSLNLIKNGAGGTYYGKHTLCYRYER